MTQVADDLWTLVLDRQQLDPEELWHAIERQVSSGDLDFRTQLLVRDSLNALERYWGASEVRTRLASSRWGSQIEQVIKGDLGEPGFPSLRDRIMEPTRPEAIEKFLQELSTKIRRSATLYIGGSAALILARQLLRRTEDIDVVDEVPAEIRGEHNVLQELVQIHKLHLAHFQSHYLPNGWKNRAHSFGAFNDLHVFIVDVYDVFLSKLFSSRVKDRQDLMALVNQLDKQILIDRLRNTTKSLRQEPKLLKAAEDNWFTHFGEKLPS